MAAVQRSADDSAAPPRVAGVLSKLRYVSNVPRKIAKFKNFAYNSVGIRDMTLLQVQGCPPLTPNAAAVSGLLIACGCVALCALISGGV